ncbi:MULTISPECIES: hypothetical protein [Pseudoalteromonas]|uniref:hypothetical protein n=1 Tax=Pseudoalteromonas TaxID=53246 RepID=UPI000785258C|nr:MULTISPECIES: hypothetical protein [Pseudoalteromonas]MCF7517094.1 hypothetical protein [Pseudoalteromonas sp. L21]UJX24759.1 hypothetical protein L3Q70_12275 [Pseudoalteromonas sp. CF6-2]|tara:strand:+ start:2658 stop:3806 length:1149 start_codon:yes stop_codon:yes gene_type:complete
MLSKQHIIKYLGLFVLLLLCWLEQFQHYIMSFIDSALVQSTVVYASSRTVNAAISLLQSAEVGIGIASIQPAQLLDPVNDLAEYMSDAMRLAIGSLFLQRILYTISSGVIFNSVFTISVIAYLFCEWRNIYPNLRHKLLASLILIRFLVPAIVLSTGLISQVFLDEQINSQSQLVSEKVDTVSANATQTSALSAQLKAKVDSQKQAVFDKLDGLNQQQITNHQQATELKQQLAELDSQIDTIQSTRSLSERLTFTELEQAKPLLAKKQQITTKLHALSAQQGTLNQEKDALNQQLVEINEQLNTNDASKVSKIIDTVTTGIGNMVAAVEDLFIDFLNLLSLLILKLLLMPLIFLYLFNKAFKAIWHRHFIDVLIETKNRAIN